jgi:hypothetical protein
VDAPNSNAREADTIADAVFAHAAPDAISSSLNVAHQTQPGVDPYLPPYSPDCDPIQQVIAKFKARLRKAAAEAQCRQLTGRVSLRRLHATVDALPPRAGK